MTKFKIVKSDLFKKQEKNLPNDVKKSLAETLKEVAKNPFMGNPCDELDLFNINCEILEDYFSINHDEVISILMSNLEFFIMMERRVLIEYT